VWARDGVAQILGEELGRREVLLESMSGR